MLEFRRISSSGGRCAKVFPFVRSFVGCVTLAAEQAVPRVLRELQSGADCQSARTERRCATRYPCVRNPDRMRAPRPPPAPVFVQFFGSRVPPPTSIHKIGFRLYLWERNAAVLTIINISPECRRLAAESDPPASKTFPFYSST